MTPTPGNPSSGETRLDQVIGAYLAAADSGETIDRAELLRAYPDLADDLATFFGQQDCFDLLTGPMRPVFQIVAPADGSLLRIGEMVGGYELLAVLGQGGMGVVYKARQLNPPRLVALKMIRTGQLASANEMRRFRTEAETAATLDHPRVVPIYEVGEHEGRLFYTMKLIEGGSLAERLDDYRDDPRAVARLMSALARAVHHAHQRQVLHRDLKPANVLLDTEGRPHIVDFGLAKWLAAASEVDEERSDDSVDGDATEPGVLVGTPGYMAPEQAQCPTTAAGVTTATDVHGLGAVLYALLTGRPPYRGLNLLTTFEQVLRHDPPVPRSLNAKVDRDLQTVCLKCLEKEPARRYGSAEALAEELDRWLAGESILARPTGWLERSGRWCRRNRAIACLLGAVAVLLTLLLVGLTTGVVLLANGNRELGAQKRAADEARAAVERHGRELRLRVYAGDMNRAARLWDGRQANLLAGLLNAYRPGPNDEDLRGCEWYFFNRLTRPGVGARADWAGHPQFGYSVYHLPDRRTLLSYGEDLHYRFWDGRGKERGPPLRPPVEENTADAVSHDGALLATAGDDQVIRIWHLPTRTQRLALPGHHANLLDLAFAPDDRLLASIDGAGCTKIWDTASGKERVSWFAHGNSTRACAFGVSGAQLITAGGGTDRRVLWWRLPVEGPPRVHAKQELPNNLDATCLAVSPDGQIVAAGDRMGNIRLFSQENGSFVAAWNCGPARVRQLVIAPNSKALAAAHDDGQVSVWSLPDARLLTAFLAHAGQTFGVSFSLDGQELATVGKDGRIRLWDPATQPMYRTLEMAAPVTSLSFEEEGDRLRAVTLADEEAWFDAATLACLPKADLSAAYAARHAPPAANGEPIRWLVQGRDGLLHAGIDGQGAIVVYDRQAGQKKKLLEAADRNAEPAAFSPNGKIVAIHDKDGLQLLDAATGEPCPGWQQTRRAGLRCFSADSRWVAVVEIVGNRDRLKIMPVDGDGSRDILSGNIWATARVAAFGQLNKTLVVVGGDGRVKLWQSESGAELLTLPLPAGMDPLCVAIAPCGYRLAVGGRAADGRGVVCLWEGSD